MKLFNTHNNEEQNNETYQVELTDQELEQINGASGGGYDPCCHHHNHGFYFNFNENININIDFGTYSY
jgi:hypothetical protein